MSLLALALALAVVELGFRGESALALLEGGASSMISSFEVRIVGIWEQWVWEIECGVEGRGIYLGVDGRSCS